MVVSVTLSHGAIRMARRRVVVRRLSAIEDLGSMDLLCTDKTGTLTEARIRLERHVDAWGRDSERVIELAYLNSFFETGLRSPLDDAILEHTHVDVSAWRKIDEVPFDFERRRVSVLLDDGRRRLLVVKGAPEDIIAQSTSCEDGGEETLSPLDAAVAARLHGIESELGDAGYRALGIAWRELPLDHEHCYVSDEIDGFLRLSKSSEHKPVNIGNPTEFTILECAQQVLAVTGSNSKIRYEALPQDDPKQRCPDITKARTLLGWEPQVRFIDGLHQTIDWYFSSKDRTRVDAQFARMLTER